MNFIVIDDRKMNLFEMKDTLNKIENDSFRYVQCDGKLSTELDLKDGHDFIDFNFDKDIEKFVSSFINDITDEDIILIDLALTANERIIFAPEVPLREIEYTPMIIKEIKSKKENAKIKVMSNHDNITAENYKEFLKNIDREEWFRSINFIETFKVLDACDTPKYKQELYS